MSMLEERSRYIESCGRQGGNADGFRRWIRERVIDNPKLFPYDAVLDKAATATWERQPKTKGPDLFSIAGIPLPEFLTRTKHGTSIEDGEFEKVGTKFATVQDRYDDAMIKMRQAARSIAKAEADMKHADECRKRAEGDLNRFLRDLADT